MNLEYATSRDLVEFSSIDGVNLKYAALYFPFGRRLTASLQLTVMVSQMTVIDNSEASGFLEQFFRIES